MSTQLDGGRPPAGLEQRATELFSTEARLDAARYTSVDFHNQEVLRMWNHAWQIACLESEVAEPGDYVVYTAGRESVLIIRGDDGQLRALSNVCRHRATCLKSGAGTTRELRCPFHGWHYELDGTLVEIVNGWDFPETLAEAPRLPEFSVDVWQGFVFVSLDPHESLLDFLGPVATRFDRYALPVRRRVAAMRIELPCNWKIAAESFPETYHFEWTHPQLVTSVDGDNPTFELLGRHGKLIITRTPTPDHVDLVDEETYLEEGFGKFLTPEELDRAMAMVGSGSSAREAVAEIRRQKYSTIGLDCADYPFEEFIDGHGYFIFPNTIAFIGLGSPGHVMRFFPNGDDPNSSIMEFWLLHFPESVAGPREEHVPVTTYSPGTSIGDALDASLGRAHPLSSTFDQDISNLTGVQRGLQSSYFSGVRLSRYHESLLHNFENALDEYLDAGVDGSSRRAS